MIVRGITIITILINLSSSAGIAQPTRQQAALHLFNQGAYGQSLPLFQQLVTLFPKDPRYQYYAGICMVNTRQHLSEAIAYLTFARDETVPRDVYFYLGKAFLLTYQYDKALDAFLEFRQFGNWKNREQQHCDMYIEMARNGKRLLEKESQFKIYRTDTIRSEDLWNFYNTRLKNGKFRKTTENSFSLFRPKQRTVVRYEPFLLDKGQRVFESEPTGITNRNKDIAAVKKGTGNTWLYPENLGNTINTPYDEDYAYFDASRSTLYFASKGHHSMGGYDIFKSVYNPDSRTWSKPENLGFPVNSSFDDFMFVPSDDETRAFFASNRGTHGDSLVIYTISFSESYPTRELPLNCNYTRISNLLPSDTLIPDQSSSSPEPEKASTAISPASDPYPEELLDHKNYNTLINEAMMYQMESDSLGRLADALQQKLANTPPDQPNAKLKKELFVLGKKSANAQKKADDYYDKARKVEQEYSVSNTPDGSAESNRKLVKNAFVTTNNRSHESHTNLPHRRTIRSEKKVPATNLVLNEFSIQTPSSYKTVNQIPHNERLPAGLIYRIQLGAFSKPVEISRFKGIEPLGAATLKNGTTKYFAGYFSHHNDAERALNKVHEKGLKDAYIVAFYNGRNIPSNRAEELEAEQ